jgi:hypothetical protein
MLLQIIHRHVNIREHYQHQLTTSHSSQIYRYKFYLDFLSP